MITVAAPPAFSLTGQGSVEVDESFLPGIGVHRIPTPVPFLEAGGPANVYAIESGGGRFTLFDCAVGTDEGLTALREGLQQRGLTLDKLERIIVSHGHVDHYGNAQLLSEESGAPVFVHPHDLEKVCGEGRWYRQLEAHRGYFLKLGLSETELQEWIERTKNNRLYARQVDRHRVRPLEAGQRFGCAHFELEVLHMPGHTAGLVCLHAPTKKLLFADDHVLARVSPNPMIDLSQGEGETKFKALVAYLHSARQVRQLELSCVLPGHGEAFAGHQPLLDNLFQFYLRRQEKLVAKLSETPSTVCELMRVLFPRLYPSRLMLMLSEVVGHLEVLELEGQVRRDDDGRVMRFRRLG